jgi:hypothetical protein
MASSFRTIQMRTPRTIAATANRYLSDETRSLCGTGSPRLGYGCNRVVGKAVGLHRAGGCGVLSLIGRPFACCDSLARQRPAPRVPLFPTAADFSKVPAFSSTAPAATPKEPSLRRRLNPGHGERRGQLGAGKGRRNSLPAHAARSSPISNGTDRLAIPSRPTRTRQSVFPVASG